MSHIHISHILTYNPVSGYQHLTPASEGSAFILTYNPMSGLTHIYLINSKNTNFESHITKTKFIQNRIIFLILTIIPNIDTYRISQY